MLAANKGSLFYALQSAYPDVHWKVWEFSRVTKKFWNDTKNQRLFMDDLAKKFNINTFEVRSKYFFLIIKLILNDKRIGIK